MTSKLSRSVLCLLAAALAGPAAGAPVTEKKALTFADLMKLRQIEDPVISDDGTWIADSLVPGRGDGEALARPAAGGGAELRIERGSRPRIAGTWLAATILPTAAELDQAGDGRRPLR